MSEPAPPRPAAPRAASQPLIVLNASLITINPRAASPAPNPLTSPSLCLPFFHKDAAAPFKGRARGETGVELSKRGGERAVLRRVRAPRPLSVADAVLEWGEEVESD